MHDANTAHEQPHRVRNAGIRGMLRYHRGLGLVRRIKATCWWCHRRTEHHEPASWLVENAFTDQKSRNSTGWHGKEAPKAHTKRSEYPTGTAPASTETNSTPRTRYPDATE